MEIVCPKSCKNSAWKTSIPHPGIPEKELFFLPVIAHLMKNLRTLIVTGKPIILPEDIASKHDLSSSNMELAHLFNLVEFKEKTGANITHKFTRDSITPGHFEKMNVGQALNEC